MDDIFVRASRFSEASVNVERSQTMGSHKLINQPVSGTDIEGPECSVVADPSNVGDAAQIQKGDWSGQVESVCKGGVINRDQRRALPPILKIAQAQIRNDWKAQSLGKRRWIPDLERALLLGPM